MATERDEAPWGGGRRLEDLSPSVFFDPWPGGELTPPADFDAYPFAAEKHREAWLRGVELLRDLVLDYQHYLTGSSRDAVARATGLSPSTLSRLNGGKGFPRLETYLVLRAYLPEHQRELREARRLKAMADAQLVKEEIQERIAAEVQHRVDAELQRHRRGRPPR